MNKKELALLVSVSAGISKTSAARAVDAVIDTIQQAVARKDSVRLTGFGVFSSARTKASVRRNPRTGENVNVKSKNRPVFKAGALFKSSIN